MSARKRKELPRKSSVVETRTLTPALTTPISTAVAALGVDVPRPTYEILRTNQVDPYDPQPSDAAIRSSPAVMAAAGDTFRGSKRRAAKLSIARGKVEVFGDLGDLIRTLAKEKAMIDHTPPISDSATSNREKEEKRNVRLRAWIYAASRESDNDFHLILGRDPAKAPKYMTMEISALPPASASSRKRIAGVRTTYKKFFKHLPGTGYDFYKPPVPVEIGGSLFFDITHAKGGGRPGPEDLRPKMPVIWEVHPVTHLVFEPKPKP